MQIFVYGTVYIILLLQLGVLLGSGLIYLVFWSDNLSPGGMVGIVVIVREMFL